MLRDAYHRMRTTSERRANEAVACADAACRKPQFAEAPPAAEGTSERALSSPVALSGSRSLTHLCATFALAIITTTLPSRIPSYHQIPPDFHRAWLSKSRYLPVTPPRAHPRASDKGETEGASGGAGSTCRKKDKKKKDEDETGAGKQ